MPDDRGGDIRRREQAEEPLTAGQANSAHVEGIKALQKHAPDWYAGYLAAVQNQQRPH